MFRNSFEKHGEAKIMVDIETTFLSFVSIHYDFGFILVFQRVSKHIVKKFPNMHIELSASSYIFILRIEMTLLVVFAIIDMGFQGGPFWKVPTGRRDGVISNLVEARSQIPAPTSNFTTLQTLFGNQGLDLKDLVLLSGIILNRLLLR